MWIIVGKDWFKVAFALVCLLSCCGNLILKSHAQSLAFSSGTVLWDGIANPGAYSVYAADLDSDGDMDILAALRTNNLIVWFNNSDGKGSFSTAIIISNASSDATSVFAIDLDSDDDLDVLSASHGNFKIAWYSNMNGKGLFSSQNIISTVGLNGAYWVHSTDLDGDNDNDILAAYNGDYAIVWFRNNGAGSFSPKITITNTLNAPECVLGRDLDQDGDYDVLSASSGDNKIAWYKNLDGLGTFSSEIIISTNAAGALSVFACDLDSDGDNDVLSASSNDNKIAWYRNNGTGSFSSEIIISNNAIGAHSVFAIDIDGDNDLDVLSASENDNKVAWYENINGLGAFSSPQNITTLTMHATSVYSADFDGDGDNDVISASKVDDKVIWYQNARCNLSHPCIKASCYRPMDTSATTFVTACPLAIRNGTSCTPTCNNGFSTNFGATTIKCTNGTLSTPTGMCLPNPCNRPADIPSTSYSIACNITIPSGQSCTPICQLGYSSNVSLTISCTTGTLSAPLGACSPNPCPRPPDTSSTIYAQVSCPSPTFSGSTCSPTCKSGYTANASLGMACNLGNFTQPFGVCNPNPCNRPSDTITTICSFTCLTVTTSGSSCVPACASGYSSSGDLTITCTAGSFSTPSGICTPSPCSPPSISFPFTHGSCVSVIPSSSSCVLGCVTGYIANGSLSITCDRGNFNFPTGNCSFDVLQTLCSQPTPPFPKSPGNCQNGYQGDSCVLGCANGYMPSSLTDFIAICSNRTFIYNSTSTAVCLENPCSLPSLDIGLSYGNCGSITQSNSSCSLGCQSGYSQVGSLLITCSVGNFSSPIGHCQPRDCFQPLISSSSFMTVGDCQAQTSSGSFCTLNCISEYTPFGIMTATCNIGNFTRDGVGYCIDVSNIYTAATSILNPSLVASVGTLLNVVLSSNSDAFVSNITVNGIVALDFRTPNLGSSLMNTNVPVVVFVTIPSISQYNQPLSNYQGTVLYLQTPILNNACPDQLRIQVYQSIVVRGSGFFESPNLRCILDGQIQSTIPVNVDPSSLTCKLYYPNTSVGAVVMLNVANDGVPPLSSVQAGIPITLIGACQSEKPGSIAGLNGCECLIGTRDSGSACIPCENGLYQDESAQTSCKPCGSNQDTNLKTGSISSSACVCSASYYYDPKKKLCTSCVPGMLCPGNNVVDIYPGYWRANNITSSVLACPAKNAGCCGTQQTSSSLCNPGYKGPLCTVCEHGYAKLGQNCIICPPSGLNTFVLIILVLFAIALAALLIHTSSAFSKEEFKSSEEKAEKERMPTLGVIVKVTLNYLQVLYYIGRLSANWSAGSIRFFTVIGQSTLTPNFPTIQCAATWTFYHRLIFIYVSPLIVVAVLVIIYAIIHLVKQKNWKDTRNDCQYAIMLLLYQIHPTIMIEVISSLPCEKVPGSGTSYLKVDMSVDCHGNAYKTYAAISSIYLIVYIFGMIILVSHRLHHNYVSDKLFQSSSSAHYKYAFFFKGFRKHTYYWEAVVMMRKLIIVALSVLASPGLQLVWASVVIGLSLLITSHRLPYSSHFINRLENASLVALFIAVILGFHFLLTNGNHTWSTVLLILIDGGVALFLLGCCLSRLQDKIRKMDRFLPESWRGDGKDDVVMRTRGAKTMEIEMQ